VVGVKKTSFMLASVGSLLTLFLIACGGQTATPNNLIPASLADGGEFERPEPPEEYADAVNPYEGEPQAVAEGQAIYQQNCVSCHGTEGKGDGPAASTLNPKPADLGLVQSSLSDGYLAWRITEGGMMEPFRSVMPAWKGILNEEKTWILIVYLRTFSG
jgi:mono/diheme cytochrome c family protein